MLYVAYKGNLNTFWDDSWYPYMKTQIKYLCMVGIKPKTTSSVLTKLAKVLTDDCNILTKM